MPGGVGLRLGGCVRTVSTVSTVVLFLYHGTLYHSKRTFVQTVIGGRRDRRTKKECDGGESVEVEMESEVEERSGEAVWGDWTGFVCSE